MPRATLAAVLITLATALPAATATLEVVSRAPLTSPIQNLGGLISADARFVAYTAFSGFFLDLAGSHGDVVMLRDRASGAAGIVTTAWNGGPANGASEALAISDDGGWILLQSLANDLVASDANDVATATTERVWLWQRAVRSFTLLGRGHGPGALSFDGRIAAFVGADGRPRIYDRIARSTSAPLAIAVDATRPGRMSLSGDGDALAFAGRDPARGSSATPDVLVYRRSTATLLDASRRPDGVFGNGASWWPSLSADGKEIAFLSAASNLVAGDGDGHVDAVVRNLVTGHLGLVGSGNGDVSEAVLSRDGCYVAFVSAASTLVPGDTNGVADVFVKDLVHGGLARRSLTSTGAQSPEESRDVGIAVAGGIATVIFTSRLLTPDPADNLNFDFDVMDNVYGSVAPAAIAPLSLQVVMQQLRLAFSPPKANG
jgi:Tol biopolymer transport system component